MISLRQLVVPDSVILELNESEHKQVVLEMVGHLCEIGKVSSGDCYAIGNAVLERESQVSTGLGSGVAIPHARVKGLKKALVVFARSREGVDFDCPDNAPCHLIVLLLVPANKPAQHLQILAELARVFDQSDRRRLLEQAETSEEICRIFAEGGRV
jgi:mannitol/fructose-specific phosphotransferase system IIA component (Ntr-type)